MTPDRSVYRFIPLLTIILLLLNLLAPVGIAFAQDADPPPEPPPAEEVAAEEQPVVEEEAPAEEPATEEESPAPEAEQSAEETVEVQEEPETVNEPEGETGEDEVEPQEEANELEAEISEETGDDMSSLEEGNAVAEAVEALDDADAILTNEEGEALEMASQEAEEVLTAPDPQFCPAGLPFGDPGCSPSQVNIADAITNWVNLGHPDGTIYIEGGASFAGVTITENAPTADLVFQGGVGGGVTTINTAFAVTNSVFNSFTFNNITFDAGLGTTGSTGDFGFNDVIANSTISISNHTGDVDLDNVDVDTTNSGITVFTDGAVNLNNVNVQDGGSAFGSHGIRIDNTASSTEDNVTVTNTSVDDAGAVGMRIFSDGAVVVDNVQVTNTDDGDGLQIFNTTSTSHAPITIINSIFDGNYDDNLRVESAGSITLDGVSASNSIGLGSMGAVLCNGGSACGNPIDIDAPITISNSIFNNNNQVGLFIESSQGPINIYNVTTDGNTFGMILRIESGNPQDVSIACSSAQNNGDIGIVVVHANDLSIKSTNTSGNGNTALITNATNTTFGTANCNPNPGEDDGDKRDGKHAPLDPDDPTPIVLDLYPHSVTFPPMNLLECEGYVKSLFFPSELPGELNAGDIFLRALTMRIEGCEIPEDGRFTIGFDIPATEQGNQFAVLFWDGATESWVEVPGQMTADGRYTVTWPTTGIFVLVTK